MIYIANAFSLQMLPDSSVCNVRVTRTNPGAVRALLGSGYTSAVGHSDTAAVIGDLLGRKVRHQRLNVALQQGDTLIVAQVAGGRLPEGATTLPAGCRIEWMLVQVMA